MFWNHLRPPPKCVQNKIKKTHTEAQRNEYLYISVQSLALDCHKATPSFHFAPNHKFDWVFNLRVISSFKSHQRSSQWPDHKVK